MYHQSRYQNLKRIEKRKHWTMMEMVAMHLSGLMSMAFVERPKGCFERTPCATLAFSRGTLLFISGSLCHLWRSLRYRFSRNHD